MEKKKVQTEPDFPAEARRLVQEFMDDKITEFRRTLDNVNNETEYEVIYETCCAMNELRARFMRGEYPSSEDGHGIALSFMQALIARGEPIEGLAEKAFRLAHDFQRLGDM